MREIEKIARKSHFMELRKIQNAKEMYQQISLFDPFFDF